MSKIAAGAVIVLIGLLLAVQGGGGLINNLFTDYRSWFLLNYLDLPFAAGIAAHVALLVVGLTLVVRKKGLRWLLEA